MLDDDGVYSPVFGANAKKDANGDWIENGIGSLSHEARLAEAQRKIHEEEARLRATASAPDPVLKAAIDRGDRAEAEAAKWKAEADRFRTEHAALVKLLEQPQVQH